MGSKRHICECASLQKPGMHFHAQFSLRYYTIIEFGYAHVADLLQPSSVDTTKWHIFDQSMATHFCNREPSRKTI